MALSIHLCAPPPSRGNAGLSHKMSRRKRLIKYAYTSAVYLRKFSGLINEVRPPVCSGFANSFYSEVELHLGGSYRLHAQEKIAS